MKHRVLLTLACTFFFAICSAQNFSGLLNKKLVKIDDMGSLLETEIGALFGGRINGKIDSVVVTHDAEKTLKVRIWYTDYINGYFTVSTMNAAKQKQKEIFIAKFTQPAKASPVEVTLPMDPAIAKGTKLESAFLRIDVAKKENGSGAVNVFAMNKNWKSELDAQNVIINVSLQAVGKAASLTNQVKDVVPGKQIKFDPKLMYYRDDLRARPMRTIGGGNHFIPFKDLQTDLPDDDISGTWVNMDANTNSITRLIVTNNNSIQGYGRCSPQDCDWGKTGLASTGGNNFKAVFTWNFKTTTLIINSTGTQLTVTATDNYTDGRPARSYSNSFKKNLTMVYSAAKIYSLNQVAVMNPTTNPSEGTTPKGPDKNFQISLIDAFSADVDFRRPQDISSINLNGFLDINKNSGIVYILPADYHLKWDTKTEPEKGYDFRILYGSQPGASTTEGGTDAPVRMSATLTAGISTRELNFVKTLLRASLPGFKNIKYLPLRENPQFTFQNTLGAQYNIPQSKITVETSTDLNNDIRVAWQTDADTKEFIQTALTSREGIAASVILKPDNEDILDQQIPAIINLADIRTLGKINLEPNAWRTRNWRNTTPYPLKLNYLHVLKKENNGTMPIIYSWSMNEAVIPSQAQVAFNHTVVPAWLDNAESVVMWMDYAIMDCNDCDKKVMDAVTGGVSGSKAQQIKFTIPPAVFDTLNASYFMITVRSLQVDPKGAEIKELPAVKVMNDMTKEFAAGPVYIPSGGAIDFEYKITVATKDGDFYPANGWIRGSEQEILLGKTRMKEIFRGIIPGIN